MALTVARPLTTAYHSISYRETAFRLPGTCNETLLPCLEVHPPSAGVGPDPLRLALLGVRAGLVSQLPVALEEDAGFDGARDGAEPFLDGAHVGSGWGTMWHGSLECDDFRRAWLSEVAREAGSPWQPRDGGRGFAALRERMIETTADGIETHIDVEALLGLAR